MTIITEIQTMSGDIYAAERDSVIVDLSPRMETDLATQEWFRELGVQGCTLVVLDLADGESPEVGDRIDVDSDGVATLR